MIPLGAKASSDSLLDSQKSNRHIVRADRKIGGIRQDLIRHGFQILRPFTSDHFKETRNVIPLRITKDSIRSPPFWFLS